VALLKSHVIVTQRRKLAILIGNLLISFIAL
jgi:hypothetical protein